MNCTVSRPPAPKYAINQEIYLVASAKRGYIEPVFVHSLYYDPSRNVYSYTLRTSFNLNSKQVPIQLIEDQITDLCSALQLQIAELEREYDAIMKTPSCETGTNDDIQQVVYADTKMQIRPPRSKFGYNQVVYLRETAQTAGRFEAIRINDVQWDNTSNQWNYIVVFRPRPEHHMTVGDADNWRHSQIVSYKESELTTYCEARDLIINFLSTALSRARSRFASLCSVSE